MRHRDSSDTVAYRMTLTPSLASIFPATAVYIVTKAQGVCIGLDNNPVAWMFGGTAYLGAHFIYSWLIDRQQERALERYRIRNSTPDIAEKYIVETRDENGNLRAVQYQQQFKQFLIDKDQLKRICYEVVQAGDYNSRIVEQVATRNEYNRLTGELIRVGMARWKNPAHHQQGVEITALGWRWMREKVKHYSPTGLVKRAS